MGFAITWCAVPDADADQLFTRVGLIRNGEFEDIPDERFSAVELDTGWHLLWCNEHDWAPLRAGEMARVSAGLDVVLCRIEKHLMSSSAERWSAGHLLWRIAYDAASPMTVQGDAPEFYDAIRQEMEAAQRASDGQGETVDYIFQIPLRVARAIVGFKHDEPYDRVRGEFEVLTWSHESRGFLQRLFGARD